MIASFADPATEDLYNGVNSARARRFPSELRRRACEKLDLLNAAFALSDLRVPPSNHFEPLKGDLLGYYSVRINAQWRIVFSWSGSNAYEVQIVD